MSTLVDQTYVLPTQSTMSLGYPTAPSWSHDGTRLAYSKSIDGTGNSPMPVKHTAIFVYDLRDGSHTQLTQPAPTLVDLDTVEPFIGHTAADYAPAWNSTDTQVAFVRTATAAPDDTLLGDAGTNVWTVSAGGGGEARRTSYGQQSSTQLGANMVWIPGTQDVMIGVVDGNGQHLVRLALGGGVTTISSGIITDFDASPDGKRFSMSQIGGTGMAGFEGDLATGAAVQVAGMTDIVARYSNSGDALLTRGVEDGVKGLMEFVVDPDTYEPSPEGGRMALPWGDLLGVLGGPGVPSRMALDVQPQTLPVVFVPGFLGSQITCDGAVLWPDIPFPELTGMNLTSDGNGNANCAGAGPSGNLVETVLVSDIYKSTADWLRGAMDASRLTLFGWDFRKEPQASFAVLDQAVTDALARPGPWKEQQAGRVVMYGHSYGGLLIRSFIEGDGGARVARVLTAGSPFWGSPKSIFPLAFGIESPLFSTFDLVVNNSRMKSLAVNLAGLYHLYPSDEFGTWLSVDGEAKDQAGVLNFVTVLLGNYGLLAKAFANHRDHIDGFYNRNGFIDVRVIAGSGMNTIGSFAFTVAGQADLVVEGAFVNGDETVPLKSATQKHGATPLGDQVGLQYVCNVSHVPLPGSEPVRDAYEDWLLLGRPPKRLTAPCAAVGGSYRFESSTIGLPSPRGARAAGAPMGFDAAEQAGLIDLINAPTQTFAVVDDDRPVTLQTTIVGGTFTYTPLNDGVEGQRLQYGPLTGTLELAQGAAGAAPVVTLDGTVVDGVPVGPGPQPTPTPTPSATPSATPQPTPSASPTPPPVGRLKLVGKPRLRGRRLTVSVRVPAAGKLQAVVRKRTRKLASRRVTMHDAGVTKLKLELPKRPRGKLKLGVTFTPRSGRPTSISATVRAPR